MLSDSTDYLVVKLAPLVVTGQTVEVSLSLDPHQPSADWWPAEAVNANDVRLMVGPLSTVGRLGAGTWHVFARILSMTPIQPAFATGSFLIEGGYPAEPMPPVAIGQAELDAAVAPKLDAADLDDPASPARVSLNTAYVTAPGAVVAAPAYGFLRELERDTRDLTILVVSDSTARQTKPWPRTMLESLGAAYPSRSCQYIAPLDSDPLVYQAADVRQVGTGTHKITLYNASRSGKSSRYVQGANWATVITSIPTPDLIIVSHGHNDAVTRQFFQGDYTALVESLKAQFPDAEMLLVAQNPETANTNQLVRAEVVANLARTRGYGLVAIYDLFNDIPDYAATYYLDGIHPNEAGMDLWAAEVMRSLTHNPAAAPMASSSASLTSGTENLAPEGMFLNWDGSAAITGFATSGPVTLSKDLTNFETKGYGMKVTSSGASGLYQFTLPTARLPLVKGQVITLAVRLYVPAGSAAGVGRIGFTDGTQLVGNGNTEGQGAFRWAVFTGRVSATASLCRLLMYAADSGTPGGGSITIDRIIVARGALPRDYFAG